MREWDEEMRTISDESCKAIQTQTTSSVEVLLDLSGMIRSNYWEKRNKDYLSILSLMYANYKSAANFLSSVDTTSEVVVEWLFTRIRAPGIAFSIPCSRRSVPVWIFASVARARIHIHTTLPLRAYQIKKNEGGNRRCYLLWSENLALTRESLLFICVRVHSSQTIRDRKHDAAERNEADNSRCLPSWSRRHATRDWSQQGDPQWSGLWWCLGSRDVILPYLRWYRSTT